MIKVNFYEIERRLGVVLDDTFFGKALSRLPALEEDGPWLAGGAVRRFLTGEKLDSDFDFFFKSKDQLEDFKDRMEAAGAKITSSGEFNTTYILPSKWEVSDEGIVLDSEGLSDGENVSVFHPELKVQLIHFRYYNSPEEILDSFDFTLSQFSYDGYNFFMGNFSLWDVARKKIVPHKITFATASVRRLLKYANQGYTVCQGGIADMLNQVADDPNIVQANVKYID